MIRELALATIAILIAGCAVPKATANKRLLEACKARNLVDVKDALHQGADPNTTDPSPDMSFSCLDYAGESPAIVEVLLKAGASPTKPDPSGFPPINLAAANGPKVTLDLLVKAGATIEAPGPTGATPLGEATGMANVANASWLLDHGAKINAPDEYGETPLIQAVTGYTSPTERIAIVKLLLQRGANPLAKDKRGKTAADRVYFNFQKVTSATKELVDLLRKAEKEAKK